MKNKKRTGSAAFALKELQEAGLFDKDSDYGGATGHAVMELMDVFSKQGHSGFSASLTRHLFNELSSYRPINEIKNPMLTKEYMDVGDGMYQSTRLSSMFSYDSGKTWYDIDAKLSIYNKIMKKIYWWIVMPCFKDGLITKSIKDFFWGRTHKVVTFKTKKEK